MVQKCSFTAWRTSNICANPSSRAQDIHVFLEGVCLSQPLIILDRTFWVLYQSTRNYGTLWSIPISPLMQIHKPFYFCVVEIFTFSVPKEYAPLKFDKLTFISSGSAHTHSQFQIKIQTSMLYQIAHQTIPFWAAVSEIFVWFRYVFFKVFHFQLPHIFWTAGPILMIQWAIWTTFIQSILEDNILVIYWGDSV